MAVAGVGSQILREIPLLERLRLRQTSRAFRSTVDESLEGVCELFWEDIGDAASTAGGLGLLLPRCTNLRALSLWSRKAHEARPNRGEVWLREGLSSPGITAQSLSGIGHCRRLRSLNLRGCVDAKDTVLTAVAASCWELESLDVGQ
eukprot:jgi/Mesvir1/16949/Mv15800-RA.1